MIQFGDCDYDREARRLTRAGKHADVSAKAFDLLGLLLEHRPRVLGKAEIRDRLWPGTFVGDTSVAKLVAELRRATGDTSRAPRYIRTVHRIGYGFCGSVTSEGHPATSASSAPGARVHSIYCLRWRSREIPLFEGPNLVGRDPECEVRIPSRSVSRRHARVSIAGDRAILEDLGSKNGTTLRAQPVEAPSVIAEGDAILFGLEPLVVVLAAPTGSTGSAR